MSISLLHEIANFLLIIRRGVVDSIEDPINIIIGIFIRIISIVVEDYIHIGKFLL